MFYFNVSCYSYNFLSDCVNNTRCVQRHLELMLELIDLGWNVIFCPEIWAVVLAARYRS